MESYRLPETWCPHCGTKLNAASSGEPGGPPDDGSLTVCMYCGVFLVFEGTDLRPLSVKEFRELSYEEQVSLVKAAYAAHAAREAKRRHDSGENT